jgi:ABC-type dipeptide/oligopeptide/nickel transport system permease component
MVAVIIVVSLITFLLMHAVPGGPFTREKALPAETLKVLNERYHLDDPMWKQYIDYLGNTMVPKFTTQPPSSSLLDDHLINLKLGPIWLRWMNFGPSYKSRSRTVNDIFRQNLPISAQLGVQALTIALLIGMPLGILAALKQNTVADYMGMALAIFGVSVPVIVLGPILVWLFGVTLKWLPPTGWGAKPPYILGFLPSHFGWEYWKYAIMPSVALGLGSSAIIARLTRASLLQTVREDYIRTARAKGLHERTVIAKHALKNSLIPVVTILGPLFAALVTGTFVTELIFGIPGMGKYFVTSITNRDYPVIMGTILLYAVFLVVANLIVDLTYAYLDPRIRYD